VEDDFLLAEVTFIGFDLVFVAIFSLHA